MSKGIKKIEKSRSRCQGHNKDSTVSEEGSKCLQINKFNERKAYIQEHG